jgi:hypothetical protein
MIKDYLALPEVQFFLKYWYVWIALSVIIFVWVLIGYIKRKIRRKNK